MNRTMVVCAATVAIALLAGCAKSGGAQEEKHETISQSALPQAVRDGFAKAYPGATIQEVETETYPDGTVHYQIEYIGSDGKEQEVELNADGDVLDDH